MKLYELAGADPRCVFSPHCWKSRLALAHKGLEVETVPWRYADKDKIAFTGQGLVPVLTDGGTHVHDSWRIAEYLEETYPDRPSLFDGHTGHALARFVHAWTLNVLNPGVIGLILTDIHDVLTDDDKPYFRESREARFGRKLEEVTADRDARVAGFRASLAPLRTTLAAQPYLSGDSPLYADYCVFASFVWARATSAYALLEKDDPLHAWCDRLYDAFDGLARSVPAMTKAA